MAAYKITNKPEDTSVESASPLFNSETTELNISTEMANLGIKRINEISTKG